MIKNSFYPMSFIDKSIIIPTLKLLLPFNNIINPIFCITFIISLSSLLSKGSKLYLKLPSIKDGSKSLLIIDDTILIIGYL